MQRLATLTLTGLAALTLSAVVHAEADGEEVYNRACVACHASGAAGAPIIGDAEAWGPRLEQGEETLYDHAINGFQAMPAKGGQPNLSDEEVKAAVDHMLDQVR